MTSISILDLPSWIASGLAVMIYDRSATFALPTWPVAQIPAAIAPRADQPLQQASTFRNQQPAYSFQVQITTDDGLPPDFRVQYQAKAQLRVSRPNKLRVLLNQGFYRGGELVYRLGRKTHLF